MQVLRSLILCLILASSQSSSRHNPGEVVPNENLVVDGIPKIPTSLAESVERYSNFRAAQSDELASNAPRDADFDPLRRRFRDSSGDGCRAERARS